MKKREIPLFEFDSCQTAFINPSNDFADQQIPILDAKVGVICFFKDAIDKYLEENECKEIMIVKTESNKIPVYLDVKKNRKDEMFLAITESKKIVSGEGDDSQVSFEKHKIFLYKEDFEKFMNGLQQAIQFIAEEQGPIEPHHTENEEQGTTEDAHKPLSPNEIKIDIDF